MPEEYTKEEMLELVEATSGFEERLFEMEDGAVSFEIQEREDEDEVLVMRLGAERFPVTAKAYIEANRVVGINQGYVAKTPVPYMVPHMNYWFDELGEERKALIKNGKVDDIVRPNTELYDMKEFIETICKALEDRGYNDYYFEKVSHSSDLTLFSVVVPSLNRAIGEDMVYAGFHIQHSFLAKKPTIISAYVHMDVQDLRGGMISAQHSNRWNRKLGQYRVTTTDDVFAEEETDEPGNVYNVFRWLEMGVGEVLVRAEREFDSIERLAEYQIGGHGGTFLNDMFTRYKIPTVLQKAIREEYTTAERQSMYDLYKSILAVSGRAEVAEKPAQMQNIMEVAGEIAAHPGKCDGCHRMI